MSENTSNDSAPNPVVSAGESRADRNGNMASGARTAESRNLVAWLALLLSLVALAGIGYRYIGEFFSADAPDPNDLQFERMSASLDAMRRAVDANNARIGEIAGIADGHSRQFEAIETQLTDRLQRLDALHGRAGALEESMAALKGLSSGLRDSWLLAEAEYYMQIANAQLQLADNPELATLALQLADEKILQLANPALTDVRRALANELRALEAIERPDIEGIALTLSSLASVVDGLPLHDAIDTTESAAVEIDPELTGIDRVIASLRKTASEIVSVRRSDESLRPLIAPEAQYFLRANLSLQFQAARIALLRGEQALFDQSLDDASVWLNNYYDTESAPVRSALQTISDVRQSVMPVSRPDISQSLRLLREYQVRSTTVPVNEPADNGGATQ